MLLLFAPATHQHTNYCTDDNACHGLPQWLDSPRYVRHAAAAADLFCSRFSPDADMSETFAKTKAGEIRAAIVRDVEHEMVQVLLYLYTCMIHMIHRGMQ